MANSNIRPFPDKEPGVLQCPREVIMSDKGHKLRRILVAVIIAMVVAIAGFLWYASDYYHADATALEALEGSDEVTVTELADGSIAFVPTDIRCGLVFYPGGKVEPEAYAPLLMACAERGVLCINLQPTLNLAILDMDAADGVIAQFPQVDTWYLGGHSLGGVVAADYLARHQDEFEGVVLLAAYPAVDLSGTSEHVLQVVGSNDGVLDRDRYEEARELLPEDSDELVIEGGNHAQFGDYGPQDGDGEAAITAREQQEVTAEAIADLPARE